MPLPILQHHADATPQDLVRLFHRTELHWARHLGEEAQLDAGVAISNPALPTVWEANTVIDATVAPGASAEDAVEEVRAHFASVGSACRQWVMNPSAPEAQTRPLVDLLAARGWRPHAYDILHLPGHVSPSAPDVAGLTIIPARASFRHARAIAEEAAAEENIPERAEASILHLDDPHWDALIALRDGIAVARAGVLAVGEIGRIDHLFVSPSQRRQGIGRTMLGRALEICARSLFRHVMVCARPDQTEAKDLHAGFGFKRVGRMVGYRNDE